MTNKASGPTDHYAPDKYPEMSLLDLVGHEVENFKPWFKTRFKKIKRTFILSPAMSSSFGVQVSADRAFLGVPTPFFNALYASRIDSVCVVKGQPGLYIIMAMGPHHDICALRIFCSKKKAQMVAKCDDIMIMSVDDNGETLPASDRNEFKKSVIVKNGLDWE